MSYLSAILPLLGGVTNLLGSVTEQQGWQDQAEMEKDLAAMRADEIYREGGFLIGAQKAAFAASGVVLRGSPMDVVTATAMRTALNAERVRWEGDMRSEQARAAGRSALMQGGGSLLSGLLSGIGNQPEPVGPGGTPPPAPNGRLASTLPQSGRDPNTRLRPGLGG